jgi:hypothetical protein
MYNQEVIQEMEDLERTIKFLEKRCNAFEEARFVLRENLRDLQWLNSHGKTKAVHDEIDLILKDLIEE